MTDNIRIYRSASQTIINKIQKEHLKSEAVTRKNKNVHTVSCIDVAKMNFTKLQNNIYFATPCYVAQ